MAKSSRDAGIPGFFTTPKIKPSSPGVIDRSPGFIPSQPPSKAAKAPPGAPTTPAHAPQIAPRQKPSAPGPTYSNAPGGIANQPLGGVPLAGVQNPFEKYSAAETERMNEASKRNPGR